MNTNRALLLALVFTCPFFALAANEQANNVFSKLSDAGFTLKRASSGPDEGEPAELGFLTDIGKETEFHANFFLQYAPSSSSWGRAEVSPSASVEGKLSSVDKTANDAWRFRLGLQFDIPLGKEITINDTAAGATATVQTSKNALWLSVDAKNESDRDFQTKKTAAQFQISPTLPDLAAGEKWPKQFTKDPEAPPVQFRWRPIFEFDLGHTFENGASVETDPTILRLIPRIRAELFLNSLKKALSMEDVSIYADTAFFYLPLESHKTAHNYFVTGINFKINKNVGLNVEYKNGEDSPDFVRTHTIGGSLAINF
jgi:hypothetical protein